MGGCAHYYVGTGFTSYTDANGNYNYDGTYFNGHPRFVNSNGWELRYGGSYWTLFYSVGDYYYAPSDTTCPNNASAYKLSIDDTPEGTISEGA